MGRVAAVGPKGVAADLGYAHLTRSGQSEIRERQDEARTRQEQFHSALGRSDLPASPPAGETRHVSDSRTA